MRIFASSDGIPFRRTVVSVGSYDGVHLGHRKLLQRLSEEASARDAEPLVVTFDPHPKRVLGTGNGFLTTAAEQILLLEEAGAENVLTIPFTEEFSRMSPETFARDFLAGKLHAVAAVMGADHSFGKNAAGKADCIAAAGIDPVLVDLLDDIGSTGIREMIKRGDVEGASALLGGKGYLVMTPVTDSMKLLPPAGTYEACADGVMCEVDVPDLPAGKKIRLLKHKKI